MRIKFAARIAFFLIGIFGFMMLLDSFFRPVWYEWNNYDTITGFYDEPDNTIQAVFLGSSVMINGITPTELYDQYGICAYNLGTEQQAVLSSYYWLEETYRHHPESLKVVILDSSSLRRETNMQFCRKAIDNMELSWVKYRAVKAYLGDSSGEVLSYLFPLFGYHSRWSSLAEEDFAKDEYQKKDYTRGYNFDSEMYIETLSSQEKIALPHNLTGEKEGEGARETEFDSEAVQYLAKMASFCQEHDLKLVLIKLPMGEWSRSDHDSMVALADQYQLEFLDFNFEPLFSEIEYDVATDSTDSAHLNYYGAAKVTRWLGKYLTDECELMDVRGNSQYGFMETQLETYERKISNVVAMKNQIDPADYLEIAMDQGYTVFIMIRDEASNALTDSQRGRFSELGLNALSQIEYRDSYLAVIDQGVVAYEMLSSENGSTGLNSDAPDEALIYEGVLPNMDEFTLLSGGANKGNMASCKIEKEEFALNERGLNIVVYDNVTEEVIDSVCFDTFSSSLGVPEYLNYALDMAVEDGTTFEELPEELKEMYRFRVRCERVSEKETLDEIGEDGMLDYLSACTEMRDVAVFISVLDEASASLSDAAKAALDEAGLKQIPELGFRDSYLAVIDEGTVIFEEIGQGTDPIYHTDVFYSLASGGFDSGNISSIFINGKEYSGQSRGFNIVVYDKVLDKVIDSVTFDTNSIPIRIN